VGRNPKWTGGLPRCVEPRCFKGAPVAPGPSWPEVRHAADASEFLLEALEDGYPMKVDADGVIRVYDPETNTFGSYNADGTTRTFFKPKTGAAYWATQPRWAP
jgi:hypothetical protein